MLVKLIFIPMHIYNNYSICRNLFCGGYDNLRRYLQRKLKLEKGKRLHFLNKNKIAREVWIDCAIYLYLIVTLEAWCDSVNCWDYIDMHSLFHC